MTSQLDVSRVCEEWSVDEVAAFLTELGLKHYGPFVRDADVNGRVFGELVRMDSLETIGVQNSLHKAKVLACLRRQLDAADVAAADRSQVHDPATSSSRPADSLRVVLEAPGGRAIFAKGSQLLFAHDGRDIFLWSATAGLLQHELTGLFLAAASGSLELVERAGSSAFAKVVPLAPIWKQQRGDWCSLVLREGPTQYLHHKLSNMYISSTFNSAEDCVWKLCEAPTYKDEAVEPADKDSVPVFSPIFTYADTLYLQEQDAQRQVAAGLRTCNARAIQTSDLAGDAWVRPTHWPEDMRRNSSARVYWLPTDFDQGEKLTCTGNWIRCYLSPPPEVKRFYHKSDIEKYLGRKLSTNPPAKPSSEHASISTKKWQSVIDVVPKWPLEKWLPTDWRICYRQLPSGPHRLFLPPDRRNEFYWHRKDAEQYLQGKGKEMTVFPLPRSGAEAFRRPSTSAPLKPQERQRSLSGEAPAGDDETPLVALVEASAAIAETSVSDVMPATAAAQDAVAAGNQDLHDRALDEYEVVDFGDQLPEGSQEETVEESDDIGSDEVDAASEAAAADLDDVISVAETEADEDEDEDDDDDFLPIATLLKVPAKKPRSIVAGAAAVAPTAPVRSAEVVELLAKSAAKPAPSPVPPAVKSARLRLAAARPPRAAMPPVAVAKPHAVAASKIGDATRSARLLAPLVLQPFKRALPRLDSGANAPSSARKRLRTTVISRLTQ